MVKYLPNNIKPMDCESAVASALEWVDRCATAEEKWCYPVVDENVSQQEAVNMQELIDTLGVLSSNQETIYNQMNEYFASIMQNFTTLAEMYYSTPVNNVQEEVVEEPVIDEKEQQRLELQAQIDALQAQMENL